MSSAVRHFRQVLLWPLRLMPLRNAAAGLNATQRRPWHLLRDMGDASPWREVVDEYAGERGSFHERHYNEFVTFLPYVQRFLYGEGRSRRGTDVDRWRAAIRRCACFAATTSSSCACVAASAGDAPITLDIVHVDLYFFFDVDVVLLNVEVSADDLSLSQAQELLYRFGRAYPAGWDAQGQPLHCLASVEWLGADGQVLARSDAQQREAFLAHVCEHRAPRIAAHWAYVLEPLVSDHSERTRRAALSADRVLPHAADGAIWRSTTRAR